MRSHGNGSLSATTQVKVSSLENLLFALGQGVHFLETNIRVLVKGESMSDVPGSKSVAGKRIDYIGTWESPIVPVLSGSFQGVEEATRKYGDWVVGLTHSRGVNGVMPIESRGSGALEGVSSLTQSDEVCYAIH